jgi:hypothetical protein
MFASQNSQYNLNDEKNRGSMQIAAALLQTFYSFATVSKCKKEYGSGLKRSRWSG